MNSLPFMSLLPVTDGIVLPEHPERALENAAKDIPVLIGTNKDEYRLFTVFDPVWKRQDPKEMQDVFQKHLQSIGTPFPQKLQIQVHLPRNYTTGS